MSIIQREGDWMLCECGNEPHTDGFFTCDETGKIVEPTLTEWTTNLYVCVRCGHYFDYDTFTTVGITDDETTHYNDNYWSNYQ